MVNATLEAPPEPDMKPILPHLFAVTREHFSSVFELTSRVAQPITGPRPARQTRQCESRHSHRGGVFAAHSASTPMQRASVRCAYPGSWPGVGKKSPHNGDGLLRFLARPAATGIVHGRRRPTCHGWSSKANEGSKRSFLHPPTSPTLAAGIRRVGIARFLLYRVDVHQIFVVFPLAGVQQSRHHHRGQGGSCEGFLACEGFLDPNRS